MATQTSYPQPQTEHKTCLQKVILGLSSIFKECWIGMKILKENPSFYYVLACVKIAVWGWVWVYWLRVFFKFILEQISPPIRSGASITDVQWIQLPLGCFGAEPAASQRHA